MIEKIKAVNNPLTIIAIFAALAEVAGTVALRLVAQDSQGTFIWFVMLFPALLVVLFFVTLNFNPKVLYAPSDFQNEENFLTAIYGVNRLSVDLEEVQRQLEIAKVQIIDDATRQVVGAGENERARLEEIVNSRIGTVQEIVVNTRASAEGIANEYVSSSSRGPTAMERILSVLRSGEALTLEQISQRAGLRRTTVKTYLTKYRREMKLIRTARSGSEDYVFQIFKPDA